MPKPKLKLKRLEDLGASALRNTLGDARLLFETGKAIAGINTYLNSPLQLNQQIL